MSISWAITKNTATNVVRYQVSGTPPIDLNQVVIGDYVNIYGVGFNSLNTGSFPILNVEVYYVVGVLTQAFEILNPSGVAQTATQFLNSDLQFFRPTVNSTQQNSVVMSSTTEGVIDVVLPATSKVVTRQDKTGSYLKDNNSLEITRLRRDKNGESTVFYDGVALPALSVNDIVTVENAKVVPVSTFKGLGVAGVYPATGTTNASNLDCVTTLQPNTSSLKRSQSQLFAVSNTAYMLGGTNTSGLTFANNTNVERFSLNSNATVADGTLAEGSLRHTYQWLTGPQIQYPHSKIAAITLGRYAGQYLVDGGIDRLVTAGGVPTYSVSTLNTRVYDPTANTVTAIAGSSLHGGTAGHSLTTLDNGKILRFGGSNFTTGNAVITDRNNNLGYLWDPATEAFGAGADVTGLDTRGFHTATKLNSGSVLIAGGFTGATQPNYSTSELLALWRFTESAGNILDAGTIGPYNLAITGIFSRAFGIGKVDRGGYFGDAGGTSASAAGNAAAIAALTGEWTVQWWSAGWNGVNNLSGLGLGPVISYCTVAGSELESENTLMEVGISGGGVYWLWENGAGIDVTATTAVVDVLNDRHNHFAVRKKFNGTNYDVSVFVNGKLAGTTAGVANCSGGAGSGWYMAMGQAGVPGFTGILDDVQVSKVALTDSQILLNYFASSGGSQVITTPYLPNRYGSLNNSSEIWDSVSSTTTKSGDMALARAYHTADLLPNGLVLVAGGLAYSPSTFTTKLSTSLESENERAVDSTNQCEIYDPTNGQWYLGPKLSIRRHQHCTVYVPSRNVLLVIGGVSTQGDDCNFIEVIDLKTMKASLFNEKLTIQAGAAILMPNNVILCAASDSDGGSAPVHELISLNNSKQSSSNLNATQKITDIGSGFFKFNSVTKDFYSSFGKPATAANTYTISTASRSSNVTTLVFVASGHSFAVSDRVFVNFQFAPGGYTSGLKVVTAVTSNSISYAEIAANLGSASFSGEVFKDYSDKTSSFYSWKAQTSASSSGPFLFDKQNGVSITAKTSTTTSALTIDNNYSILQVADATAFPDEEGFIVLGFGTTNQTLPIKYLGRYSQFALLIDYGYKLTSSFPVGTDVNWLYQREPFEPSILVGSLYATPSAIGRITAQNTIKSITAAGFELNIKVVFPGDSGLGNQGYPYSNANKLSDAVYIWGGDEPDLEIKELRDV